MNHKIRKSAIGIFFLFMRAIDRFWASANVFGKQKSRIPFWQARL